MSFTLYLDTTNKDLVIEDYNLKMTTTDGEYIAQKIENLLLFFKGEWFLNEDLGLPYYDDILIKNPDLNLVTNLFKSEVLSIEEIKSIKKFEVNYNNSTRILSINWTVISSSGDTITGNGSV